MSDAADLAEAWLRDGQQGIALPRDPKALHDLAWAIKDRAFAAWSSEPAQTRRGASALAELAAHARSTLLPDTAVQACDALMHWTAALARLTQGEMAEAIGELDLAQALWERLEQPAEAAQTRVARIMALSMLGRHGEAVACAQDAQQRFIALGDRLSAAKTSLNLGSLHLRHDQYAQAADHYRQASVLFARVGQREHSVMADIGIGDALTALGDVAEAGRIYARARMRAQAHGLALLQALADESMGLLDLVCGRYGSALAALESARKRYAQLQMPQHLAIADKQLADAYLALRLLPPALALYDEALVRLQQLQMPDDQAWTLVQQGRAQTLIGRPALAADAFDAALRLFQSQDNAVGLAAVQLAQAELARQHGDAAGAFSAAALAHAGFAAAGHATAALDAQVLELEAALALGLPVLEGARGALVAAHGRQLRSLEVRCAVLIGDASRAQGDLAGARAAWSQAIELFEAQRRALPSDDTRIAFLTDHLRPYRGLLALACAAHRAEPSAAHAAEVLHWLDRTRARSLDERLATSRKTQRVLSEEAQALQARWTWVTRELERRQQQDQGAELLEQTRLQLEHALLEQSRRAQLAMPEHAREAATAEAVDGLAHGLRAALGAEDALVEYGFDGETVLAVVVRTSGLAIVTLPTVAPPLRQAVRALRFQIDTLRHGAVGQLARHADRLTARALAHLQTLHSFLWAPLLPHLDGASRVQLVVPAELAAVPFAALWDGHSALCERIALGNAPSARWLLQDRTARAPTHALVAAESSRLAHALAEAQAVAAHFASAQLLQGADARADQLAAHAATADVLHLACHAEYRGDNPMFSALHLHDGPLSAAQIEHLTLAPGATVVLGACDTALGDDSPGDEHLGLVRAFMVAGAARVVAALWPVDDATTAQFMQAFYGSWLGGCSVAHALRQAQLAVRAVHPHPYYWAGFVLHGVAGSGLRPTA